MKVMKFMKMGLILFLSLAGIFLYTNAAQAGTTQLHIATEAGGNIADNTGSVVNGNGCMFWNGSSWVTNDTAAHMYFVSIATGERLAVHNVSNIEGTSSEVVFNQDGVTVTRSIYTYQSQDSSQGTFAYEAVQYDITQPNGFHIVLRSRGTGHGINEAYFDIYVENPAGELITALRADPVWFSYSGLELDDVLAQTSASEGKTGELITEDADYFMDINGGSDMGGVTLQIHTGTIAHSDILTSHLGSTFPIDFTYEYLPPGISIPTDLCIHPGLVSETHTTAVEGTATDASVNMAAGNREISRRDDSWEIKLSSGTLKGSSGDDLSDDVKIEDLPDGLNWAAENAGDNKIKITVSGKASAAVSSKRSITAAILGSAVNESGLDDSKAIELYLYPVVIHSGGGGGSSASAPSVITFDATSITDHSAVLNGKISARGDGKITDYGFSYSNDETQWKQIQVGEDNLLGDFSYTINGLIANSNFYFKAYATNDEGTSYGAIKSFTALQTQPSKSAEPEPTILRFYVGRNIYYVNDQEKTMDTVPIILADRTLLPIRYVAEAIGATANWNEKEQKATIILDENSIELWINQKTAAVNGHSVPIDADRPQLTPVLKAPGRSMLPLRFISENLGCEVLWNADTQEIKVIYPGE